MKDDIQPKNWYAVKSASERVQTKSMLGDE